MIKAYFVGISMDYEGEDIEVRYAIYEDDQLLRKETFFKGYVKPVIVSQVALVTLLKDLKKHMGKEITVFMNDPALNEVLRGTSQTKNRDVIQMLRTTEKELSKFGGYITITDISTHSEELAKWNEILHP